MVVTKDLGAFPFDEKGNGSKGLFHGNEITSINKGHRFCSLSQLKKRKKSAYQTWKVVMVLIQ